MPSDVSLAPPKPESELRNFHKFLERFSSEAFHGRVAEELLKYPQRLDEMLERSLAQCMSFETSDAWHNRDSDGFSDDVETSSDWARELVVHLARQKQIALPKHGVSLAYVDYELSPFRESGESRRNRHAAKSPITGRLDVLMTNAAEEHPAPVIVEVKAATDSATTLRTLIQLLAYAVELGTPQQRARLNSIYPGRFATYEQQSRIDICVMKASPTEASDNARRNTEQRHEQVRELIAKLLEQPGARGLIRRVIWMHPENSTTGTFSFTHRFTCTG
jgi:hypothetical protein